MPRQPLSAAPVSPLRKKERNSSIELLRIIAMLFIVLSHAGSYGGFAQPASAVSINSLFLQWSKLGGIGVNIFILISGYFLCEKELKLSSAIRLLAQGWFYSLVLFLVCRFGFGYQYRLSELLLVFLPNLFYEYWFLTAYLILLLLSPFVNKLLSVISRQQHLQLIVTTVTMWIAIRTFTTSELLGATVPYVFTIYIVGAYFRKYPENWFSRKSHRVIVTVSSFGLLFLSALAISILSLKIPALTGKSAFLYAKNSLLSLGCGVGLFSIFLHRKPFYSKWINVISGCTFGVYLLHENPVFRTILWNRLFNNAPYINSPTLIPRILLSTAIIYILATLVEFLRQKTVDKPLSRGVEILFRRLGLLVGKYAPRVLK